jgi:hypothetical protein
MNIVPQGPLATMVGSLPHRCARAAARCVAKLLPELPCWPQLPRRSRHEGLLLQTLGAARVLFRSDGYRLRPIAGLDTPALAAALDAVAAGFAPGEADGFAALLELQARGGLPRAQAIKGQLCGPVTLAIACQVADDQQLIAALGRLVVRRAVWQARNLAATGLPVLICFDEPLLGYPTGDRSQAVVVSDDPTAVTLLQAIAAVREAGAAAAVHVCGSHQPPWLVCDAAPSFDAQLWGASWLAAGRPSGREGIALVGWVPTAGRRQPRSRRFTWHLDPRQCWVTPACGLGLVTERQAVRALRACTDLAHALGQQRARYLPSA